MNETILSESSIGEIFLCGKCGNIHLTCGNFTTAFTARAFQELEKMVSQANQSLFTDSKMIKYFSRFH